MMFLEVETVFVDGVGKPLQSKDNQFVNRSFARPNPEG
jgi:hypothetical protein